LQQRDRPEREADGIGRFCRQRLGDALRQVAVRRRIVWLGGTAMPEQIDADHFTTGVTEQFRESTVAPRRLERTTPAVDENDGCRHGDHGIERKPASQMAVVTP
jgi:hypothetical protein